MILDKNRSYKNVPRKQTMETNFKFRKSAKRNHNDR